MSYLFKGALLASSLLASTASAATLEITVTNNQGTGGLFLTPLLSIFHDGTFDTFNAGSAASSSLEALAEEGDASGVIADVTAANSAFTTEVVANPAGFGGAPVLDPGEVTTLLVDLDPTSQLYFSFLSMVIPSNDTFIGNDNATAYEVFDSMGNFVLTQAIEVFATDAWDAGTEEDNGNGAAFAPPTGTAATDTMDVVAGLSDLNFLLDRPQAPGGMVESTDGKLLTISFAQVAAVPLPAGLPLLAVGLGAFGFVRRRSNTTA